MSYKDVILHRHTVKDRILVVMGGSCQICGYNKCARALDIHHIDPSEKELIIAGDAMSRSWYSLCKELEKCILVCANCHREIHANIANYNNLKSSYNSEIAKEFSDLLYKLKTRQVKYCLYCGTVVTIKAEQCVNCFGLLRRKTERPDRETLKKEIREIPFTVLSKKYKVSDNAIRHWCKYLNLPFSKTKIQLYSDEEWLLI